MKDATFAVARVNNPVSDGESLDPGNKVTLINNSKKSPISKVVGWNVAATLTPYCYSLLNIDNPLVNISVLKKEEKGNRLLLHCYNATEQVHSVLRDSKCAQQMFMQDSAFTCGRIKV